MATPAATTQGLSITANPRSTPAVLLVLAAMASGFLWSSGHDDQRCVELVLLALLVPLMLARAGMAGQIARMSRPGRWCLGAFFTLGIVSALTAFSLRHALYEWSMLLLLLLAAALLAAELARAGTAGLQIVLRGVAVIGILYCLRIALMYTAMLATGTRLDMHALFLGFSNARFFNHAQTALLPLVVLLYLQSSKGSGWRRASFALAACWWALLFVSEARASILALGAGCVLAFAIRRTHARDFLKAMALSALAGALIYILVFILLPILAGLQPIGVPSNVVARTAADPSSGRTLLWKLALQLIAAHPWLGIGPHHFAHEGHKLYIGAHPHDWLLQIAVEWGVPALLCLLSALALGARGLVRSGKRIAGDDLRNQQVLLVLLATCAAIFVDGLFSGVLVMPQSQLAIALVIGCAVGWTRSLDTGAVALEPAPVPRYVAAVLVVVALCGLVWSVEPSFMQHVRGEALTPAELAVNPNTQWPRLWRAGYF